MKKTVLFASVLTAFMYQTKAQIAVTNNINGTPLEVKDDGKIKGSRYLIDDWVKGQVLQEDNKSFQDMLLKYDVLNDQLIFKDKNNQILKFKYPVKQFQLLSPEFLNHPSIFKNGFPATGKLTNKSFYLVLAEGKATLLKKPVKSINESIPYGESTKTEEILNSEHYYVLHNTKMVKIKKDKESLIKTLTDKRAELDQFAKQNELKGKSDEELIRIIEYYNTLQ